MFSVTEIDKSFLVNINSLAGHKTHAAVQAPSTECIARWEDDGGRTLARPSEPTPRRGHALSSGSGLKSHAGGSESCWRSTR